MSELFRRQALNHATRRIAGEVILASPLSLRLLGGFSVAVVVLALVFASMATYARKETVAGWIAPEGGLIRVTSRDGGVVDSILVSEGQEVERGQPLLSVRLSTDGSAGDTGTIMLGGLAAEDSANTATKEAAEAKLKSSIAELRDRRQAMMAELAEARRRYETLSQNQALLDGQVRRGEQLSAKGYLATATLENLRGNALAAAGQVSEARMTVLTYERQIGDINRELGGMPAELASIAAQTAVSSAAVSQRRSVLRAQSALVVTAPIAGKVVALPVNHGQTVAAGSAVVVVTPRNASLIVELFVPSRAAGFLRAGQSVRLMYQAFPYQRFGTGSGTVYSISRTALAPNEVAIPGLVVQEPVFRARVRLDRPTVSAYGREMPLQSGMLVSADVVIDRRSLLQWLLDPLYAAGRRV